MIHYICEIYIEHLRTEPVNQKESIRLCLRLRGCSGIHLVLSIHKSNGVFLWQSHTHEDTVRCSNEE